MTNEDLRKEMLITKWKLHSFTGEFAYHLEAFGEELARREGYKDVDGMEAIHLYLIRTHHWLPRDVRSMSSEDIRLVLHVEMQDWDVPDEVIQAGNAARALGR